MPQHLYPDSPALDKDAEARFTAFVMLASLFPDSLALLSCRELRTGQAVPVIVGLDPISGGMRPIARLFIGDPNDEIIPPHGVDASPSPLN